MYKILLLLDYSSEFERNILRGLVKYSTEYGPWLFYRLPLSYRSQYGDEGIIKYAKKWKANAIIGRWDNEKIDLKKELQIPVVIQNYHHRRLNYSNLTGDYRSAGLLAADFFRKKGFHNYAYLGVQGVIWSEERLEAFRESVLLNNGNFFQFKYKTKDESELRRQLRKWLKELPKPIALFCCDDENALFVSETCKIDNIHIPSEIALLGVDNDELICNISDPPISSIELNVEAGGYAVGKLVHEMIKGEFDGVKDIVISPVRIEMRQSTEKYDIRDPYIARVVHYINENYKEDLTVSSLLENIPLSRRSFEMKFKKIMNTSVYKYLLECRCRHLAELLVKTNRLLSELFSEVGFNDCGNISRVFKQIYGCSPKEYRKNIRTLGKNIQ